MMSYFRIYGDKAQALKAMNDDALGRLIKGMIAYSMEDTAPTFEAGSPEACLWFIMQSGLDADRAAYEKKAEAGRAGGKQTQADGKQTEAKPVSASDVLHDINIKNQESRIKNQESRSTSPFNPPVEEDLPAADSAEAYVTNNLQHMSATAMEECVDFIAELGADVVKHAVDVTCDAGKRTWGYCRAILNRYAEAGIKTLGDAKASDDRFRENRARGDPSKEGSAQHYTQRATAKESKVISIDDWE